MGATHHPPTTRHGFSTSWSRKDDLIHVTYDFARRVHVAKFYPVRAPNGSSIVLYGHDDGLTCIWSGGRPLKRTKTSSHKAKNGRGTTTEDDVVMIDDDDENHNERPQKNVHTSHDDMFAEEDEHDFLQPFDAVVDTLEVTLGSAVFDITFSPVSQDQNHPHEQKGPGILHQNMVVAVACADSSIRLITLPLTPPNSAQEGQTQLSPSEVGVQVLLIESLGSSSRSIPCGISMTWTTFRGSKASATSSPGLEHRAPNQIDRWSFLLAYHFTSGLGKLKVLEICLDPSGLELQKDPPKLLQIEHLPYPVRSLSFNPSVFPSEKHAQILTADAQGVVRIYEPLHYIRETGAYSHADHGQPRSGGAWLMSLQAPFEPGNAATNNTLSGEDRTDVLDAQWALGGRCIVVLLADGQWGIWDLSGIGPGSHSGLNKSETSPSALLVSGGGINNFTIRGYVGNSHPAQPAKFANDALGTGRKPENTSLAPMTPKTRKSKQGVLFAAPTHTASRVVGRSSGGISLDGACSDTIGIAQDDSLIIWYNSEVFSASSLISYWEHAAQSMPTRGGLQNGQTSETLFGPAIPQLVGPSIGGEMVTRISQAPPRSTSTALPSRLCKSETLVCYEHRFIIIRPMEMKTNSARGLDALFYPFREQKLQQDSRQFDQEGLDRGELGLYAMDKMLADMSGGAQNGPKRVGFSAVS